jgi:prepilin-type N-terminal cleavage/methylation domain-containing protein
MSRKRGFTLVELMLTLLILGLIMSVIYRVFSSQEQMFRNQEQVAAMQENLRSTVEYLNQEMSWIGYRVQGVSVVKASPTDIVFKANIPNTSDPIQYVRYQFVDNNHTIRRWAGPNASSVDAGSVIMATDIQSLSFSFFNVQNDEIVPPSGDPLCASELSATACSPSTPSAADEPSLLMVQRIKARVTARTARPDWRYTDPNDPNTESQTYRKRRAVLDVRARNVEDATIVAGQIGLGSCGDLIPTINPPASGSPYNACRDKLSMIATGDPDMTNGWTDNPSITIQALDKEGNLNTLPGMSVTITASGTDAKKSLFRIFDDTGSADTNIDNGETRYIVAGELSDASAGNEIEVKFQYLDGICTMVIVEGSPDILVGPSEATHFDTTGSYGSNGLFVKYVDLSSGNPLSPSPDEVKLCSAAADEGISLEAKILDDCGNPISGETVLWGDSGAGGSFTSQTDNGDGTYSATYVPPDSMGTAAPEYPVTLDIQWGAETLTTTETLVPSDAYDIVIDSIVEQSGSGLYLFDSTILPDNNSTFEIERVDNQLVRVDFHLEDQCGNRVYVDPADISVNATTGDKGVVLESNGLLSFTWWSNNGCGAMEADHTMAIEYLSLTETVTFDLLETVSGPRLILAAGVPGTLVAGNTADFIAIDVTLEEYDEVLQLCYNVPGPYDVTFEVEGTDPTRSGSFSGTDHQLTSTSLTTSINGEGSVELHPGTAQCRSTALCDALTVTATAEVEGAFYDNTIGVGLVPSDPDKAYSGFMHSDYNEVNKVGENESDRSYDPGETIYIQVKDYDENESPYLTDSTSPLYAKVTLTVQRTGDVETVNLTENLTNTALFRGQIGSEFSTAATVEDGTLQVRYGDRISMHYEDKDDPAEFDDWDVFVSGPRIMNLYRVDAGVEYDIFSGGVQSEDIHYEDNIRVKIYFPEHDGDGSSATATDSVFITSGDDDDILQIREYLDTGVFVPDWVVYGAATFSVSQSDPGDAVDRLSISSTPRSVTVSYPDAVTPIAQKTFVMYDQDVPYVEIMAPSDGSSVAGTVLVTVNASDVGNTSALAGISRIELYINSRLYDADVGADLTGDNNFTWTTTIGLQALWLDGDHVLTARAYDTANNLATSSPVRVTLNNNIIPIEFTSPAYASVWGSTTIPVEVQVSNLDTTGGPYQVYLSVSPGPAVLMSDAGGWTYTANLDGRTLVEGTRTVIATVEDAAGNDIWTTIDIDVDRTPPSFDSFWWPEDWVNMWWDPVWFDFEVRDLHGFADSTNPVLVSLSGPNGFVNQPPRWSGSWIDGAENVSSYVFTWSPNGASYEGSISWTVQAWDSSNPPNMGTFTQIVNVDTIRPTIDTPNVSPAIGSFIRGTVDISTQLHDTYPWFVEVDVFNPFWNIVANNWADSIPNVDGSGNYTFQWDTTSVPDGEYIIQVGGWDRAWNDVENWWMNEYVYYVDNDPPTCSAPYQYNRTIVDNKINLTYEAADTFSIHSVDFEFYAYPDTRFTGPLAYSETISFPFDTGINSVTDVATLDVSSLPDGRYYVYTRARDWAGNESPWSSSYLAYVDRLYLQSVAGSYNILGVDYELTVSGALAREGMPAPGETLRLYYNVYPAGSSTPTGTNVYTATDAAGLYSDTYSSYLGTGDRAYVYHYDELGNYLGYVYANVPNAPTSYTEIQLLIAEPVLTVYYDSFLDEYSYETGGILMDDAGAVASSTVRITVYHYDSGGTPIGSTTTNTTTAVDGSYYVALPGSFPAGDRLRIYHRSSDYQNIGYFDLYNSGYYVGGPYYPRF